MASKTPRTPKVGRKEQITAPPLTQQTDKENEENVQQQDKTQSGRRKRGRPTPKKQQPKKAPKKTTEDSPQSQETANVTGEGLENTTDAIRTSKKTIKKGQQKRGKKYSSSGKTLNFFEMVSATNTAVDPTIEEWKSLYATDRESATLDVINFIIEASGCTSKISAEQFRNFKPDMDISPLLQEMSKESGLEAEGGEYPIVSRKQQFKKFKPSFLDFWKKMIVSVSKSILYDGYFIPTLLNWLVAISLSEIRPFRHTATITALVICRTLSNIAAGLTTQLNTNDRQLKSEKKKENASSTKIKDLEKKSHQLNAHIKTVEKFLERIFEEIFAHRYRDIFPEIRSLCITSLGDWIHEYPKYFYTNAHLRYIGWCLSDRASEVRLSALKVLENLILKDDLLQQQQSFVQYFKNRMIQMIEDKDVTVVVEAIKLASQLAKARLLSDDEIAKVYSMISDENAQIRVAAASFIYENVFEPLLKAKETSQVQMRALLDFIEEHTQHPDLPHYVVDALWDKVSFLREWEVFTDLLLIDAESKKLSESQQLLLIRMLNCCVKKSCGERIVPDQKDTKKAIEKEIQQTLTQHLVKYIPELLSRFKTETEKVTELVEIPRYFLLDVYYHFRLQNYFSELLNLLKEVFVKQVNDRVFKEIAKTVAFLLQEHPLKREADVMIQELTEEIHKKLKNQVVNVAQKRKSKTSKETEQFALAVSLKRLSTLSAHIELSHLSDLYSTVDEILSLRQKDEDIHEEAVSNAISFVFYHILWLRSHIDLDSPQQALLSELIEKRNKFFVQLEKFLTDSSNLIREKAYLVATDLFIVFSRSLREARTTLAQLSYDPSVSFVQKIKQYFLEVCDKITDENDDEEILKKEKIITALAKSIVWGAFPMDHSPMLLEQFVRHGKYIEEIIRVFLTKLRAKAAAEEWRYILEALKATYQKSLENTQVTERIKTTASAKKSPKKKKDEEEEKDESEDDETAPQLQDFERLAKRLANSYGVFSGRSETLRRSLATLVVQCMKYALEEFPSRVDFLHGAIHFVIKLDPQSAPTVNEKWKILTDQLGQKVDENDSKLKPYFDFKAKLENLVKEEKKVKKTPTASARKRAVKKRLEFASMSKSKESDEEDVEKEKGNEDAVQNDTKKKGTEKETERETGSSPARKESEQQSKKRKRESHVISLYDEDEGEKSKERDDDILQEDTFASITDKQKATTEDNEVETAKEAADTELKETRRRKRTKTSKK